MRTRLVWVDTLGSVLLASAIPLIGVIALWVGPSRVERVVGHLMSFGVGALLGGATLHLIPAAVARLGPGPEMSLLLLLGFLGFFVLEKLLGAHSRRVRSFAAMYLAGDAVHNFLDGMVIAAAYGAAIPVGLAATAAVILHEVPEEIGTYGVLLRSGLTVRRAIRYNVVMGLTAILGALLVLVVGHRVAALNAVLLPVAAGNFLYIAAADLVPELQRERNLRASVWQVAWIGLGIGLMLLPALVE